MFNILAPIRKLLGLDFYVSELDQFLAHYDKEHPRLSPAQRAEREKYLRIYRLRDDPNTRPDSTVELWNNF